MTEHDLQGFYDTDAKDYKHTRWRRNPIMQFDYQCTRQAIEEVLTTLQAERVLEVGSGPGTWTELFVQRFKAVTAVELSQNMIEQARSNKELASVEFHHSDFSTFETAQRYDVIFAVRSFEYFADKSTFLRQAFEFLKPNGKLIIITKTIGSYWYKRTKIRRLLRKLFPGLFKHEDRLLTAREQNPTEQFWQDRVYVRQLRNLLKDAGFRPLYHRPVIVRPPIFMRGKGEIPIVPPALENPVLGLCKLFNRLLKRNPKATIFAESFLMVAEAMSSAK
jgi:ubiquinone/menaquinone biosynthesis C-methylase UbiE